MPAAGQAAELTDGWCGHLGPYSTVAMLCGPGGKGDALMQCQEDGQYYSRSDLAKWIQAAEPWKAQDGSEASQGTKDHPAHEGAGKTGRMGSMNAPVTQTGHPEAQQPAPPSQDRTEEIGEGHVFGNLTEAPELRFTPSGRAVTKLRVCYRPRIKNPDTDKWQDGEPEFYSINVWGRQAENCAEVFAKGDRIVAAGIWVKRYWTGRDGDERETVELTAKDIGPSLLFRSAEIQRPDPGTEASQAND